MQSLQSEPNVAPTVSDHLPGAHSMQSSFLVTPFAEEYVPAIHSVHAVSASLELAEDRKTFFSKYMLCFFTIYS